MKKSYYIKFFRVLKYDTAITEISTNDFKPLKAKALLKQSTMNDLTDTLCVIPSNPYFLPADEVMFYGYKTKVRAMEKAKSGAQAYIDLLIKKAEADIQKLKQYRTDHYQDLNSTLLEASIRKLENALKN